MSIDVVMPQMGESIAEGTIVRWIKHVGDTIDKDEPLFEISTDKVDAEIPSPSAGVLLAIAVKEGETVPVNSVVAVIGEAGEVVDEREAPVAAQASTPSAASTPRADQPPPGAPGSPGSIDELRRTKSSPAVRKAAREHGVDISDLAGTGLSGRVTKKDIAAVVDRAGHRPPSPGLSITAPPAFHPGDRVRLEKMSIMRRKIAEHMVLSARTSPHVYATYEVDFGHVETLRQRRRAEYESAGVKLTYTAFIAKATVDTIREFPFANASVDGDTIVYKQDINLGIAVALEQGLIVPVVRKADECSMLGLARTIQDLASRARTKQLHADEVQGGTFTITNPGIFGALFGLPLISQPQVAILGVGSVEKRPVVVDDGVVARHTCYLSLGFDHRLIDGADGGRFLQALKDRLEGFDEALL